MLHGLLFHGGSLMPIDWVYDDLNDAHEHDLMHIVYMCLDYINDEDYE